MFAKQKSILSYTFYLEMTNELGFADDKLEHSFFQIFF